MRGLNKKTNTGIGILCKLTEVIQELLCPPHCVICDSIMPVGEMICKECRKKLPFVGGVYCMKCGKPLETEEEYCLDCKRKKHYFTQGVSLWTYSPVLKKSMYRFKYSNKKYYAKYYAKEICDKYRGIIENWSPDYIIAVPLFRKKEKKRGYNQAQVLAKHIGKELAIPVEKNVVARIRNTVPQKKLNDTERQKNLKGAFKIERNVVKFKRILLVDDIFTTGSTVDEISHLLLTNGAERVYVATLCIGKGY